ncbi:MAG: cupin domain-containing protein, partial [Dehalococcoidales bacterium]|nr:cupin domain-containing protein [Dehalococcoidales bacterium]
MKADYEKYLVRRPVYEAFGGVKNRQSPTMTILSNRQLPGVNYYLECGWIYGIPDPNPSLHEHVHNYDEIVMHWGGDWRTPQVLGGEIEFYVGGQPIVFNTTTFLYIPRGTPHGPVIWRRFDFPHMQMAMMIGTGSAGEAWGTSGISEAKDRLPQKTRDFDYEQYAVRSPLREAGAEFIAGRTCPTLTYMSAQQIPGVKFYIEFGWTFGMPKSRITATAMPEMSHPSYDEIVLHIGGDPADPEDLGADIEFTVGGQPLRFSTTSALFIPRNVAHGPIKCLAYRKPHIV